MKEQPIRDRHGRKIGSIGGPDDAEIIGMIIGIIIVTVLILGVISIPFLIIKAVIDYVQSNREIVISAIKAVGLVIIGIIVFFIAVGLIQNEINEREKKRNAIQEAEKRKRQREEEAQKRKQQEEARRKRLEELERGKKRYEENLQAKADAFAKKPDFLSAYVCRIKTLKNAGYTALGLFKKEPALRFFYGVTGESWDDIDWEEFGLKSSDINNIHYLAKTMQPPQGVEYETSTTIFTKDKRYPTIEMYWGNRDLYEDILSCISKYTID